MDLTALTSTQIRELLLKKEASAQELVRAHLENIERKDGEVRAYLTLSPERALEQARKIDSMMQAGQPLPRLAGVPAAVKDVILTKGVRTTCGSKILENYIPPYDATAAERLERAGACILGKTNCDEFAMGSSTENSGYFTTRNPHDLARVPGGSSGGSAAALAAGLSALEMGSDIGASIRNPAHYCGVFGHKPTWGICPPLGQSIMGNVAQPDIAVIGPLARSADDLALGLDAIAGPEEIEAGIQLRLPLPRATTLRGLHVAVMLDHPLSEVDAAITGRLDEFTKFLRRQGAKVSLTARPDFDLSLGHQLYITLLRATTSARLDDAEMRRWTEEAARLPADDMSYYAMMARGNSMRHRDYLRGHETREKMRRA